MSTTTSTTQLAEEIVRHVGGRENVSTLEHCTTRLRFTLRDGQRADKQGLSTTPGVISVVERGGQLQVVVGNAVADVYQAIGFSPASGGSSSAATTAGDDRSAGRRAADRVFDFVSGTFSPLLWALVGSSMIRAALALLTQFGWLSAESSTHAVLYAASNAVFYFLPIFVGVTASLKLGANPYVGGVVGAALLEPTFTALGTTGDTSSFLGLPMVLMSYSSQVFPVMIAAIFLSVIEKALRRALHKNLHLVLIPFVSLMVVVPVTMLVFGPFGVYLGQWIADGIELLNSTSSILTGALIAGSMLFLVTLGLHWALVPIILANLAATGTDTILAGWAGYNFALVGVAVGVLLSSKDTELRAAAGAGAASGALAGVSEPLVYGVVLRYRRLIPVLVVAAVVGGALNGAFGVKATGFLFQNVFTIPGFQPVSGYLVGIGAAFALGVVGVFLRGPEKRSAGAGTSGTSSTTAAVAPAAAAPISAPTSPQVTPSAGKGDGLVLSPLSGRVVPLKDVPDPVFAGGVLGAGVAVLPTTGEVRAPFAGRVVTVARTGHAIGLVSDEGLELLVHIGIDTVKMGGRGFSPRVTKGDLVAAGDLLVEFDLEAVRSEGYDLVTPVLLTATKDPAALRDVATGEITTGSPLLRVASTVSH
ncbi:PTS beta-glucoside transporter subunit EIIBCA [Streptomyces sp. NP160]|uniref:glucose PTS transporter subunit IIA n=1 Tax=Streptomyces sp. NP160 TaxID=2586637 RepID=UPI0011199476|nr:glucose PTS transporter subunit IIA [Streptomyces sp. NP160]TNM63183.1 PTS beta-glucoside transporter subunit EIIBCA [Streptomyces sp. NP160]